MRPAVALAFTAGLLSPVSPCGFAMLPAYLSYFLATGKTSERGLVPRAANGLLMGAVVSAGFAAVYGSAGLVFSIGLRSIVAFVPWIAIGIGVALVVVGALFVFGRGVSFVLPEIVRPGKRSGLRGAFVFGLAYATASLSCTLPAFLTVVSTSITAGGAIALPVLFLAYILGVAAVIFAVSVSGALAKEGAARSFRRMLRYVHRVSGALLILAGIYIVLYWVVALTAADSANPLRVPVRALEGIQEAVVRWLTTNVGTLVAFAVLTAGLAFGSWLLLKKPKVVFDITATQEAEPTHAD